MRQIYAVIVVLFCTTNLNLAKEIGKEFNKVVSMFQNNDQGSFTSCGPKESNFMLQWSPRVLRTGTDLLIDASLTLVDSFDHGNVNVTVWLQGVPDPIYQDYGHQSCNDALKLFKKFLPGFRCPIPKGYGVDVKKFTFTLAPTIPLPAGKFHIEVSVFNENNVLLLCASGDVEAQDD